MKPFKQSLLALGIIVVMLVTIIATAQAGTAVEATTPHLRHERMGNWVYTIDLDIYQKVFLACLSTEGSKEPNTTHYNDTDETIKACAAAAERIATIKEEHKPEVCTGFMGANCTFPE